MSGSCRERAPTVIQTYYLRCVNLADALRAAEAAYAAESQMPDDGLPVDPASVSAPTFAKSKVINVRVVERDHAALTAIAGRLGCGVSDVVRSAIHRYLRTDKRQTR